MNKYYIMRMSHRRDWILIDLYDYVNQCNFELKVCHYGNIWAYADIMHELELRLKLNIDVTIDYVVSVFEERRKLLNMISDDEIKKMLERC